MGKVIQLIKGRKAMNRACRTYQPKPLLPNTHQITGKDRDGKPIYLIGTRQAMTRAAERYQAQGVTIVLSEIISTPDEGITARRIF